MRFIVTGGAGFIGSHIAELLLESGKGEVVVVDNLSVGKLENVHKGCKFYQCDILDKQRLCEIFKPADIVFHDAAFVSIRGSFESGKLSQELETNCTGTLNTLEAAVKAGAKKFIFASSMAIYGHPVNLPVEEPDPVVPLSPYGLSKLRGELYCRIFQERYGLETIALRYFNTYGTRQTPSDYVGVITKFIDQVLNAKPITVFGDGRQTRDFVCVKDVARANLLAAFSDVTGVFNVASGSDFSIDDIADLVIKNSGQGEKSYKDKPEGEIDKIVADISKITKELDYHPQYTLEDYMPQLIQWWTAKSTQPQNGS